MDEERVVESEPTADESGSAAGVSGVAGNESGWDDSEPGPSSSGQPDEVDSAYDAYDYLRIIPISRAFTPPVLEPGNWFSFGDNSDPDVDDDVYSISSSGSDAFSDDDDDDDVDVYFGQNFDNPNVPTNNSLPTNQGPWFSLLDPNVPRINCDDPNFQELLRQKREFHEHSEELLARSIVLMNRNGPIVLRNAPHKVTQKEVDALLECSVCFEAFRLEEDTCKLACTHVYHEKCLAEWAKKKNTCPLCRTMLAGPEDSSPDS